MYTLNSPFTLVRIMPSHTNVINILDDGIFYAQSTMENYETIRSFVHSNRIDSYYFRPNLTSADVFLYDAKIAIDQDGFKLSGKRFEISINGKYVYVGGDSDLDFFDDEDHLFNIFCAKFDVRQTDIETIQIPRELSTIQKLFRMKQKQVHSVKPGHYISKNLKQKMIDKVDDYHLYGKQIQLYGFDKSREELIND